MRGEISSLNSLWAPVWVIKLALMGSRHWRMATMSLQAPSGTWWWKVQRIRPLRALEP